MPLSGFHPIVAQWFLERFRQPTAAQIAGWEKIRNGSDVLITAPTGSGKTLAAFLICLDGLVRQAMEGELPAGVQVVYVSPLKALSNDIRKNLEVPLREIRGLARRLGQPLSPIRSDVRTGDTLQAARQRMAKDPPHVLVTTPESLFILLTSDSGRRMLASVHTVIFDEIHATADDKRGAHLALTLARLERNAGGRLQRIGLSATVSPIEEIARFLSPRAEIVESPRRRDLDLAVETPSTELGPIATNEAWADVFERLCAHIRGHATTLIFVNTRRLAERLTHELTERLGEGWVLPHHGSLSRELRMNAEDLLKSGQIRAVVATASLELGIDIGAIELVCQIGSPRSLAAAVQRVGRAGHQVGGRPKGRFFALTRDEVLEAAALVRAIHASRMDSLSLPRPPRDILAQHIVAMTACEEWHVEDLFRFITGVYSFRNLERCDFDAVLNMLADGVALNAGRSGARLHYDRVNGLIRARSGARMVAITSGGAIPENANYRVVLEPEGAPVGTVDEDFAVESMAGDVFLLGSTSWKIRNVRSGIVHVEDARGAAPSIPFWFGESPGRTRELSEEVARLRSDIERLSSAEGPEAAAGVLTRECVVPREAALQLVDYVCAGSRQLGAVPTGDCVVAERFFDDSGGMQLVIHAPFGARINRAWGLALRKRFCRGFNFELQAAATDNGIVLSLTEQHSFPLELVFRFLQPESVREVLTQALLASPMFGSRWRWNATRALSVLRFSGGRKVPPPLQRMRSDDLLAAVFPDQAACAENLAGEIRIPSHPLVDETIENCLFEAMDLPGLEEILRGIEAGTIAAVAVDTPSASVFSHEILNANPYAFLDDAPLEERRARAVQLRSSLPDDVLLADAALDPEVIAMVAADAAPVVRNADELHDAMLGLVLLPPRLEWRDWAAELAGQRRLLRGAVNGRDFWVAPERLGVVRWLDGFVEASPGLSPPPGSAEVGSEEEAAAAVFRGWLEARGPVTAKELLRESGLRESLVETALARLEAGGEILRGRFTAAARHGGDLEWVNRRLLARIHRATLAKLRREIEPVPLSGFLRFLARWHHILPGTQLHKTDGLAAIVRQLQGWEAPAPAWECGLFAARLKGYSSGWLDGLCLSGEMMWGRLSPHPSLQLETAAEAPRRRIRPTRAAPIAIFPRESVPWLIQTQGHETPPGLSPAALRIRDVLATRGACFFNDLVRFSGALPSEVEDAVWELVSAGEITSDGFENLRALIDEKRRKGQGRGRHAMPRHASGRWSLLNFELEPAQPAGDRTRMFARCLLDRWGVVFRDLVQREPLAPPWRDLLPVLRRMESAGTVRGGRFIEGTIGEQFGLPEAVTLLRSVRRNAAPDPPVHLHAADPLNLIGVLVSGERPPALSGRKIILENGELSVEEERSAVLELLPGRRR